VAPSLLVIGLFGVPVEVQLGAGEAGAGRVSLANVTAGEKGPEQLRVRWLHTTVAVDPIKEGWVCVLSVHDVRLTQLGVVVGSGIRERAMGLLVGKNRGSRPRAFDVCA